MRRTTLPRLRGSGNHRYAHGGRTFRPHIHRPTAPWIQVGNGEYQRHLRHERHTATADSKHCAQQALQGGGYGRLLQRIDIVGGDTTSSYTGLAISITCIGEARKDDIVYRSGAKDTDLICVSGDLGAAYMGLQLLEREKSVYYQQVDEARKKNDKRALEELRNFQPDFAGKEYLLQRQLQTEARGDIIAQFRELGIRPTAMMDISDGLSSELMHICKESGCGCRIYEKNIPIDYQTAVMAEEMNMNVTTCALNGGEDYELLFTVPIGDNEKIQQMDNVKLIGHITRPELGQMLVTRDNQEFELKAQGWNPLSKEE